MEPAQEFQWCVPARLLEPWPELFGIFEVINVFGKTGLAEVFLSLTLLAVWLTICLAWGIFPSTFQPFTGTPAPASRSHLRTLTMLLVAVTSIFFLVLTTGLNKVVVVFAALHNYFEWLILGYVYIHFADAFQWLHPEKDQRLINWQRIATWWIFSVILVILAIPDILDAFAFEEVVGLWPDFQLAVFALICWCSCPNPARECHRSFALAAVFHLVQIFILLGQGMGLVSPFPTGQLLIMFLAFANYAFLARFALLHDEAVQAGVDLRIKNRRLPRIEILMILCLCLSASSVLGPPLILGDCSKVYQDEQTHFEVHSHSFAKESNKAAVTLFNQSMTLTRASKGNLMAHAFVGSGSAFQLSKWANTQDAAAFHATHPELIQAAEPSTWRAMKIHFAQGANLVVEASCRSMIRARRMVARKGYQAALAIKVHDAVSSCQFSGDFCLGLVNGEEILMLEIRKARAGRELASMRLQWWSSTLATAVEIFEGHKINCQPEQGIHDSHSGQALITGLLLVAGGSSLWRQQAMSSLEAMGRLLLVINGVFFVLAGLDYCCILGCWRFLRGIFVQDVVDSTVLAVLAPFLGVFYLTLGSLNLLASGRFAKAEAGVVLLITALLPHLCLAYVRFFSTEPVYISGQRAALSFQQLVAGILSLLGALPLLIQ